MNNCATCIYASKQLNKCLLSKLTIDINSDYCSKWSDAIDCCDLCGNAIPLASLNLVLKKGKRNILICAKCLANLDSCNSCANVKECSFETDPSSLPKVVQKQIKNGNMVMTTNIRNPERIDITCRKNCNCFSEENGCLRQFNSCGNHVDIY